MTMLPARLLAPDAGWTTYADVVVVGSGIAGLTAALQARQAGSVLVVTKDDLSAGSTQWAQGGIAAALGPGDTPEQHLQDTLVAGVGLCDEAAVRLRQRFERHHATGVTGATQALRELSDVGADVQHQVHAMVREHRRESTGIRRLGTITRDVESAAVGGTANQRFEGGETHGDPFRPTANRR